MSGNGDAARLVGSWRLISSRFVFDDSGESHDVFGANPLGRLIVTAEGRMMAILGAAERTPPADAADVAVPISNMLAYTGAVRIESDRFVTTVDFAWHPAWMGTEQMRYYRIEGDTLSITTAPQTHPSFPGRTGRAVLVGKRE